MDPSPRFLMTDPSCFDVCYQINPWMKPTAWRPEHLAAAQAASANLKAALKAAGAQVETVGAVRGLPDLVFPANAAVVLDGTVLLARFRHPERQGEEAVFRSAFTRLQARGLVDEIVDLPEGVLQEGAGDCIWDAGRSLFWVGYGQRSTRGSVAAIRRTFGQAVVALELASDRFYHLDTCFAPLEGGFVMYFPQAFDEVSVEKIEVYYPAGKRIIVTEADALRFACNVINVDRTVILNEVSGELRDQLKSKDFLVIEVALSEFLKAGGAAKCLVMKLSGATH